MTKSPERDTSSESGCRPRSESPNHAASLEQGLQQGWCLRQICVQIQQPEQPAPAGALREGASAAQFDKFQVEFAYDTQFFAGISQDMSCGGLFIATYRRLAIDTPVRIDFELPDGTPVQALGEVVWVREKSSATSRPGLALAFTEISADALRHIAAFCQLRPPLFLDMD